MKKTVKKIAFGIIILPFAIIILYILWEVIGIICNNIAGNRQTRTAVDFCESKGYEVIDSNTFVGNSGNGNHVDLISYLIIKTDVSKDDIADDLPSEYRLNELDKEIEHEKEMSGNDLEDLEIPENTDNCYFIKVWNSAPFSDNIMGH